MLGWAGIAGFALLAATAWIAQSAWSRHASTLRLVQSTPSTSLRAEANLQGNAASAAGTAARLPARTDIPVLLSRIERAAVNNGLPWTAASYHLTAAGERQASSLEVQCAFKAPYPNIRAMVADLLTTVPVMTFRELSFVRPNAATADVDAKLVLVVFLGDDAVPAGPESHR